MRPKLLSLYAKHRQLILYGVIGASGATIDFVLYLVFYKFFHIPPFIASFLSVSAGIVNNFILNARHNFKVSNGMLARFLAFYLVGVAGALLSAALIYILFNIIGVNPTLAKLITIAPVVLLQFFINKHVSFSEDPTRLFSVVKAWLTRNWLLVTVITLSGAFYFSAIFYLPATDDMDNMLGGKLIWQGQLPYSGFFSHHTPGMYFLSALLYPLSHGNVFAYRLLFNIITFSILLATFFLIKKRLSIHAATLYLALSSVGHSVAHAHLPLGESLVALLLPLICVILLAQRARLSNRMVLLLSLLLAAIPFLSLAYLIPAAIIYLLVVIRIASESRQEGSLRAGAVRVGLLIVPYVFFLTYLYLSRSLHPFMYNLFTFNATYYAPMVGEHGGTIPITVIAMLTGSIHQIITVLKNMLNPHYAVQLLELASFLFLVVYLWRDNKKIAALAVPFFLLVLDTLTNVYNAPAISSPLGNTSQHAAAYIAFAFFAASIGITSFLRNKPARRWHTRLLTVLGAAYLIVLPLALLSIWATRMDAIFIKKSSQSYWQYSQDIRNTNHATIINTLMSSTGTAWIGPSDFPSQLYLKPARATHFTFYMPWLDASPELRREFLQQLRENNPKVIYMGDFTYNGKLYRYNDQLHQYLDRAYFTVPDSRLSHYFFNNDSKEALLANLEHHGYAVK